MPRPLRLDYPGAHFHITSRGVERRSIYLDDSDRRAFLKILATACERHDGVIHAFCLMRNHYHLLLGSLGGHVSELMQHTQGAYARWFNRRHDRVGHLFQGRFKASLIDSETYLLEAVRYIELNPCRAGLVTDPADWEWSSLRPRINRATAPPFLATDPVLNRFGSVPGRRERYREYLAEGLTDGTVGRILSRESIVGSSRFLAEQAERARVLEQRQKVPRDQRTADRPSLAVLLSSQGESVDTRRLAVVAFARHRYKMTEIARHLGVHYTTVSRWVNRQASDDS